MHATLFTTAPPNQARRSAPKKKTHKSGRLRANRGRGCAADDKLTPANTHCSSYPFPSLRSAHSPLLWHLVEAIRVDQDVDGACRRPASV